MDNDPQIIDDNIVVRLDYSLYVDGRLLESSQKSGPIEFIQGTGNVIRGLERELNGMRVNDSKELTIAPEDGYGVVDPKAFIDVPRSDFPPKIPLDLNTTVQVRDADGNTQDARISKVGKENIRLDFNHPLAGKELFFQITVAGIRQATEEEIAHGHVHGTNQRHKSK